MAIRVVRILEYVYQTNERAEENMARWVVPQNGKRDFGNGMEVRSATFVDFSFKGEDENLSS